MTMTAMHTVSVSVRAGARREHIAEGKEGTLSIAVREQAERGEANRRVREIMAERMGVPYKSMRIVRGVRSPRKVLSWK